ncbi:MAG: ATP-binding protein [Parachlamydiaceae bacterium]|nr:ATP-binding protein [Parachlamydiaceae bacterium]
MTNFEKAGSFYLGQILLDAKEKKKNDLLLYDAKNLTTHAVCLGMTGSGKTGLCIALLEEAGLDQIPAIIIDPKGDVGNLLLTFPNLAPEDFRPWIDEQEARRKNLSPDEFAKEVAESWREGLASSGEDAKRIQTLLDSVEMVIYTPGNTAGVPISILNSFAAPLKEELEDQGAIRDQVLTLASSLLALIGIDADPVKSREHIMISTLIDQAWSKGENLDISTLIQLILKPPFSKIGALDIDTFFPLKDRRELSIRLNGLLASPSFQAWMEGEPLDIKQLLRTPEGKPKFSIFSIAHLSDAERMFFVTLLLNEILTWMRRESGTSSLKALLYMDEIFGYFPPVSMPPSKLPMLTLLKQARAYGLGVVLATQNPVDLDYKGLSNCGTWFIGKLQTSRDKARVTEGLKIASNGEVDTETLDTMLSNLAPRSFILRSIYEKEPIVFKSRWALSYLRGPMTLAQIKLFKKKPAITKKSKNSDDISKNDSSSTNKPIIPFGIPEFFLNGPNSEKAVTYSGKIVGVGKLHFVNAKHNVDEWQPICWIGSPNDDGESVLWEEGGNDPTLQQKLNKEYSSKSQFEEIPSGLLQVKNYAIFKKSLEGFLYQNQELTIQIVPELNLFSKADENDADFHSRMIQVLRANADEKVEKLRDKYADKVAMVTKKLRVAEEKASKKQSRAIWQKFETFISFFSSLLGAFFGRGFTKGTITQTGNSIKRASKIGQGNQEAAQAEEDVKTYKDQIDELQEQMQQEIKAIYGPNAVDNLKVEKVIISPRKSDISIEKIALLWVPVKYSLGE